METMESSSQSADGEAGDAGMGSYQLEKSTITQHA
jgi:hypothetical protein